MLMATMSFTTGYVQNITMMFGPKMLASKEDQGRAASILVFFLVAGLGFGSALSSYAVRML